MGHNKIIEHKNGNNSITEEPVKCYHPHVPRVVHFQARPRSLHLYAAIYYTYDQQINNVTRDIYFDIFNILFIYSTDDDDFLFYFIFKYIYLQ